MTLHRQEKKLWVFFGTHHFGKKKKSNFFPYGKQVVNQICERINQYLTFIATKNRSNVICSWC